MQLHKCASGSKCRIRLCGLHAVFQKTTEDGSSTYYNRVFGGWAEVMHIILPLTELLTIPGHAGSRSR